MFKAMGSDLLSLFKVIYVTNYSIMTRSVIFRGEYEIAEGTTAAVFNAVLDYYHTGVIHCPPHVPVLDLRDACDYFLLPFNAATVKCQVIIQVSYQNI